MSNVQALQLTLQNVVPHADAQASKAILELWKQAADHCQELEFSFLSPTRHKVQSLKLEVGLQSILSRLSAALDQQDSFDQYREAYASDQGNSLDATIDIQATSAEGLSNKELYELASVFEQQLFLSLNICYAGAGKFLGAQFNGHDAHLFEAQSYDSKLFYDARMSSQQKAWPTLSDLSFSDCWSWISEQKFSDLDIAISDSQKLLVNLLKLAQQRQRFGSRSVLLATQELNLLLGAKHSVCENRLRKRAQLILGDIPEAADCFIELYRLRNDLIEGTHPVMRPALICHTGSDERKEQLAAHNQAGEMATAMIIALVQQLIIKKQNKFEFEEKLA